MLIFPKMKKFIHIVAFWVLTGIFMNVQGQCPTIQDLRVDGDTTATICAPGSVVLSVNGIQMPSKGTIKWYYSEDKNFDPRTQGALIGTTNLPELQQQSCPAVCPDLLMIMMNSCDAGGREEDNEFFIFSSGSGFYASDLQFQINSGTNTQGANNQPINTGSGSCSIQRPSAAFMNSLRTGACSNLNLFPAGPGDFIPADALVIFYMSANVTSSYDLTTLCGSGHNVYVMQNACQRSMGAFTNVSSGNQQRRNFMALKNCAKCIDSLNYDLTGVKNLNGEYIVDNDFQWATVANGSIRINQPEDSCKVPDLSNYLKPNDPYSITFNVSASSNLCGKKVYFKAYVQPSDEAVCKEVVAEGASLNVVCADTDLKIKSAPASVCSGNPINIELENQGNYTWTVSAPAGVTGLSGGSGTVSAINQVPVYNGSGAQTVTYSISLTKNDCNVPPVTVSIQVGAPLDATISGNTQVCSGGSTTLSVNANGAQVRWSTGSTASTINVSSSGTYTVTLDNGVCKATDSVVVNIGSELKPVITGDTAICQGGSTLLTASDGFDTYTWSNGQTSKAITVNTPGTYTVTVTKDNCTGSATVQVITGGGNLAVTPNVQAPSCSGIDNGSATLQVNYNGSYTVTWSTGETGNTIAGKAAGSYNYLITYGQCSQNGTIVIPEAPLNVEVELGIDPVGCDGSTSGSVTILEIKNGTAPYQITFDGAAVSDMIIDNLSTGAYTLVVTDANGCSATENISIVQADPVTVTLPGDMTIRQGESVSLSAQQVSGISAGDGFASYSWNPATGLSCSDCANPAAKPGGSVQYVLTVTNFYGCEGTDTINIEVLPALSVYLPTAFSPNGDGKNDVLYILTGVEGVVVRKLEVFNRWGESVYKVENTPANIRTYGWNGQHKGKPAPVDNYSYYYEVVYPDGSVGRDKGSILLIR